MSRVLVICALGALVGSTVSCAPREDDVAAEAASTYQPPDVHALVQGVKEASGGPALRARVVKTISARWSDGAGQALWADLAKYRSEGLLELYGVETFGLSDGHYEAVFAVRTRKGCSCLFARQDLQEMRGRGAGAPRYGMAESVFDQLRERIALHLPLDSNGRLGAPALDGDVLVVHTLREGDARAVLWHAPSAEWDAAEDGRLRAFRDDYDIDAVARAIRAHAPQPLFASPGVTLEEAYSRSSD